LLGFNEAEARAFNAALADMRYKNFHEGVLNSMLMDENRASMERQGSSLKASKFVFTRSQAEIAERLGVSPQEYARAMSKVTK
jgi:hypothetical protein